MPAAYLTECDQGLYGGVLGAEPRFLCDLGTGWISSMVPPLRDSWDGLERLRMDPASEWFLRYLKQHVGTANQLMEKVRAYRA